MEELKSKIWEFWQAKKLPLILGLSAIFLVGGWFYLIRSPAESTDYSLASAQTETWGASAETSVSSLSSNSAFPVSSEVTERKMIYVDVKGAVKKPGVYRLSNLARVSDAVAKAGGATKDAWLDQVNLAYHLEDEMLIYVPTNGQTDLPDSQALVGQNQANLATSNTDKSSNASDQTGDKINLNTASKEQLMTLSGIGDKRADDIIAYRQENGGFKSLEDLQNVSGIGEKTYAKLSSQLAI